LKKLIKNLEKIRGRHTELISIYIPSGYNIQEIISMLRQEYSLTQNVKSKATRHNVLSGLEKTMNHLKTFKKAPENGLVVFCGNVSEKESQVNIGLWSVEPPQPLAQKIYWCDQTFVLDPLKDMMKEKEIYGLIVLDTGAADIGWLKGKKIILQKHLDSLVPGKTRKGGWCVSEDSLIQTEMGVITKIKNLNKNDLISVYDFKNMRRVEQKIGKIMKRKTNLVYKITTKEPTITIELTPEHRVFVFGENDFEEKCVENLKVGDKFLSLKKSCIQGNEYFLPKNNLVRTKKFNQDFCQLLGYMMGDADLEKTRFTLYDSDNKLIEHYKKIIEKLFGTKTYSKFRSSKNYYQLRVHNKNLVNFIRKLFGDMFVYSRERKITNIVHTLPKTHIGSFLRGFYDAEGYISQNMICITVASEEIIKTLQFLLIRFGIISSYIEKKGGFSKKTKYGLRITDFNSIRNFKERIGFNSIEKNKKLEKIIRDSKFNKSMSDQIPTSGKLIFKMAKELRMNLNDFPRVQNFFYNKKMKSYNIFEKEIIQKFKNRILELKKLEQDIRNLRKILRIRQSEIANHFGCSTATVCDLERRKTKNNELKSEIKKYLIEKQYELIVRGKEILSFLEKIQNSDIIQVKISKIKKINKEQKVYDLSIPKYHNFIVNTLLVHNSQQRYSRIRDEAKRDFLKKTGEIATSIFKDEKNLKGIIIGGPGSLKEKFDQGDYLEYQLKQKRMGLVDTGYTGIQGLEEIVKKGESLIQEASIVKETKLLERFFENLQKDNGLSIYGLEEVRNAMNVGAIDILLVSENYDWLKLKLKCQCGFEIEKESKPDSIHKCSKCETEMNVESQEDLIDILSEESRQMGSQTEIISVDSREGMQFKELGGLGAILRFRVE